MAPEDVECEGFDITYTRIAGEPKQQPPHHHLRSTTTGGGSVGHPSTNNNNAAPSSSSGMENDVHQKVDAAIESFLKNLSQIGPELLSVRERTSTRIHA